MSGQARNWMLLAILLAAVLHSGSAAKGQFLGQVVTDPIRLVDPSFDDVLYPVSVNGRWGQMNQHGDLVVYPRFDWTDHAYDGFSRAVMDGRTGFIVGSGDWRIEPQYLYADRFEEGYAVVGDGEKFGYIDKRGRLIVRIGLDGALRFKEGMAAVMVEGRVGFIDVRGRPVIAPQFARARSFHDGVAMVAMAAGEGEPAALGYIDKRGKSVFMDRSGRLTDLGDFEEGMARVRVGEQWGYLNRAFKMAIQPQFEDARDFTGGLAAVKVQGRWGYINKTGKLAIAAEYDAADDFDGPLAMIAVGQKIGFIGRSGRVDIAPQFEWAEPFWRGYAKVSRGMDFAYVDVAGRVIWDPLRAAERGFVDMRLAERAGLQSRRFDRFNRLVPAPPPQPQASVAPPYPPEHLYEQVLPALTVDP